RWIGKSRGSRSRWIFCGGGEDPATERGKAVLWLSNHLKGRGFYRISNQIYQDVRNETLNEIGADAAIADFADWCDGRSQDTER
ncbi:hypothetical protein ACC687_40250, partial [Rhizobium ruizarguesonis]